MSSSDDTRLPSSGTGPGASLPEDGQRWHDGLRPYMLAMYVIGALAVLACLPSTLTSPPELWRIAAVVALCSMAELPLVERRVGHNTEAFTFAEIFLLLGLVLIPGPALVVLCTGSVLVFHLACRMEPRKALFNAAACAVGAALAVTVNWVFSTGGSGADFDALNLVGVVLGTLAYHVWNSAAISGAMSRAQCVPFLEIYNEGLRLRSVICAGNIAVGCFIAVVGHWSLGALLLLPPVLITLYFLYRGNLRANQERDVWQQLEVAARELNVLEQELIADAALRRAQQLFRTDSVELILSRADGGSRVYSLGSDGIVAAASEGPSAFLHTRSAAYASIREEAEDGSVMTFLAAPLEGPKGRIGALRLVFGGPVKFRPRERQVLSTFAHSVSSALQNAQLYTEMRSHAESKAYEASHDGLTGLGNRALLHDKAQIALETATEDWQCALLIIDLDHFKEVNDTLGHAAGDVFLQQVGQRIVASVKEADAVCRLGGDEFAVLISGLRTTDHADAVASRLLTVLAEPVSFDGLRLSIEGSVGVACYPADASSFDELLRRADVALYQAKTARGSFSHYRVDRDESSLHRLALAAELRTALAEDQFVVHFQPQYDLATMRPVGAEALVRWEHPKRGLLAPDAFIGAVEHSGLIRDFTMVVVEKAVAECASWAADGSHLTVAVNLSARNLLDSELPVDVSRVLLRHGLPAERLVLEITETTMMSELEVVEEVLGALRTMGVQLSVDDFGTGYSSLAFLQRVAVNEVKIDRSFVAGLAGSESDRALVRATVQLAHSLGARAVGEGVEDQALAQGLLELGCDFAQGYHLGRPMPADALRTALGLRQRPAKRGVPTPRTEVDTRHLRAVAG